MDDPESYFLYGPAGMPGGMEWGDDGRGRVHDEVYGFWVDNGRGVVVSRERAFDKGEMLMAGLVVLDLLPI